MGVGNDLTHMCCCWVPRLILVMDKILCRVTQAVASKHTGKRGIMSFLPILLHLLSNRFSYLGKTWRIGLGKA